MTKYDNTNRWILSRNERRDKDTSPQYTGTINIEGKEYWINGWVQEKKGGSGKFLSGTAKPKEPITLGPDPEPPARRGSMKDQLADDLPF